MIQELIVVYRGGQQLETTPVPFTLPANSEPRLVVYQGGQQLETTPVPFTLPANSEPRLVKITIEGDMTATYHTAKEIKRQFELRGLEVRQD